MKNLTFVCVLLLTVASCCEETIPENSENKETVDAILLKPDLSACLCCGGYILQVGANTYNFEALPANASSDFQNLTYPEDFPISVKVNFTSNYQCGHVKYISLTEIQKVN
jgi:hypothetical protein